MHLAAFVLASLLMPQAALSAVEDSTVIVRADITVAHANDESQEVETTSDAAICSGFVARARGTRITIATARHCTVPEVEGYTYVVPTPRRVQFFNGDIGIVRGIRRALDDDVAYLDVVSMRAHPALAQRSRVSRGEALFVVGSPNGWSWSITSGMAMQAGTAVGLDAPLAHAFLIESAASTHGDSGAAVCNVAGEAVGILVAGDGGAHVLVEPIATLRSIP